MNLRHKFHKFFITAAQEMKFSIKDFFSKCDQMRKFPADLVTFTEEILNRKLHFLCSDTTDKNKRSYNIDSCQ